MMNSAYRPSDMTHQVPLPPATGLGYSMPPMHHQYQHPHQQPPPPQPRPMQHHLPPPPASHHLPPQQSLRQHRPDEVSQAPPAQPPADQLAHSGKYSGTFSQVDEKTGRKYSLDVVQQPRRARMCGFGDKDRRPITPPPCVRLIITDIATGKEIDCNDVEHSMFVLNVDLWNEDGTREVNLVRSSTGTPSISSTTPFSYSSLNGSDSNAAMYQREPAYNQSQSMSYGQDYPMQQGYGQATSSYPPNGTYGPPQQYFPQHGNYRESGMSPLPSQNSVAPYQNPQGMFTRNLIGSLAASAFRLSDTNDQIGVWFVLQDLSVRTEGPFRLRFSFVNVGPPGPDGKPKVNKGRTPILASCFSEVFNVYSAKKFPGVCESTPLSKTFAAQGIKIPIRKDANIRGGEGDEEYD